MKKQKSEVEPSPIIKSKAKKHLKEAPKQIAIDYKREKRKICKNFKFIYKYIIVLFKVELRFQLQLLQHNFIFLLNYHYLPFLITFLLTYT